MSKYPGLTQHMAGAYSMNRQFEAVTLSAALQNMRTDDWFGKANLLSIAQWADAKARGEIKLIRIVVTSGTVTSYLKATPGDQQQTATTAYGAEWNLQNYDGLSSFYLDTGGGAASFEIYVEFDIARTGDV